jgi:hypothetical protein
MQTCLGPCRTHKYRTHRANKQAPCARTLSVINASQSCQNMMCCGERLMRPNIQTAVASCRGDNWLLCMSSTRYLSISINNASTTGCFMRCRVGPPLHLPRICAKCATSMDVNCRARNKLKRYPKHGNTCDMSTRSKRIKHDKWCSICSHRCQFGRLAVLLAVVCSRH